MIAERNENGEYMDAVAAKAVLDYTKDPKDGGRKPFCLRCGQEIQDMSKAVPVTFNCDTFEVVLGHDIDTGYHNQRVIGNELLGSDYAKVIGLTKSPRTRGNADA